MCACVHVCMCACVHGCMRASVHACIRACLHVCMRTSVHMCMCACEHVRMCARGLFVFVHVCMHTRERVGAPVYERMYAGVTILLQKIYRFILT